jgi:hypothetical protein
MYIKWSLSFRYFHKTVYVYLFSLMSDMCLVLVVFELIILTELPRTTNHEKLLILQSSPSSLYFILGQNILLSTCPQTQSVCQSACLPACLSVFFPLRDKHVSRPLDICGHASKYAF